MWGGVVLIKYIQILRNNKSCSQLSVSPYGKIPNILVCNTSLKIRGQTPYYKRNSRLNLLFVHLKKTHKNVICRRIALDTLPVDESAIKSLNKLSKLPDVTL